MFWQPGYKKTYQLEEIEDDIDSVSEILGEIEITLKLLLTSFKTEPITAVTEISNEAKPKLRLSEISLTSYREAYSDFANFKLKS